MATAEQDQWSEIAGAVRANLAKLAIDMPLMKFEEVRDFVNMCTQAELFEISCHLHDDWIECRRQEMERTAKYGG